MKRDRRHRRVRGVFRRHPPRDACAKRSRHRHQLGVRGEARARAGHELTRSRRRVGTRLQYDAAQAVAQGIRISEPSPHFRVRGRNALGTSGFDHLAHEVRPGLGLADQRRASDFQGGTLSSGAYERETRGNQERRRSAQRGWDFLDTDLATGHVLEELLHGPLRVEPSGASRRRIFPPMPAAADVYAYWQAASCGTAHAASEAGTRAYYREIEAARYRLEPFVG